MSTSLVNSPIDCVYWKRRLLSVFAACWLTFAAPWAFAQTCSIPGNSGAASIATQPNTFFPGTSNPVLGTTSVTVSAGTGTNSPISAGDLLLIIQMQGADIDATDTNAYGDATTHVGVTNTVAFGVAGYAGGVNGTNFVAGNYEWAVATSGVTFAAGGTINLSAPLTRAYFTRAGTSAQGKQAYQVIRVPQYSNLTLTAGITVIPWDGARGGVLVLEATGDINLNGQVINGSGRGFRGAGGVQLGINTTCTTAFNTTGCQAYRASITLAGAANLGGSKGEGSVGTPGRIYTNDPTGAATGTVVNGAADGYVNGDAARGAPGNAGGGGNQHNAGGGGGGNGGAGGKGGNSWNSSIATFVGLQLGGFGGSTSGNSASRWIMGGGGGAGDRNDSGDVRTSSGGAGGALIILRASRIVSGGATINTNGAPGLNGSASTDAAGAGGAGGTVVLAAGTGGLNGALTVNALGGAGGAYLPTGDEQDGAGGGGGGGTLISNLVSAPTFNATGGAAGASASNACPPIAAAANCGQAAGAATAGSTGYAISSPGVQVGYECLPNLTVAKSTTTPTITSATGATADYVISISNSGGAARFVTLLDTSLPPGWTYLAAPAPTYTYAPIQPLAAGRLSTGAETSASITTSRTWVVGATPLTVSGGGANSPTWSSFAIAPVRLGVPAVVTVTFRVSIPDTATVGTYHNGAGITFLDPTRPATTRTVSPLSAVAANRSNTPYSANTTYANYNGVAATDVGGANYNGQVAGPTFDDVRLVPDFSITKTAPAAATAGTTYNYTITPRNNGRAIAVQVFSATQATDVVLANLGTVLGASPLTLTDTLPTGVLATNTFAGTNWVCSGTSPIVCTLPDINAYPIAAATNFPLVTGTVRVTCLGGSGKTNTAVISPGAGETLLTNNTGTVTTTVTPGCVNATLTIAKFNSVIFPATLVAGQTTSYTITVANLGPGGANNTTLRDVPSSGLSCTSNPTCTATAGAACPVSLDFNILQGSVGLVIPTLGSGSTVTFALTCGVTATGL